MTPAAPLSSAKSAAGGVVLVPGMKFFVRRIPLAAEGDVATQVELALETISPFPLAQLFHGFATDPGRKEAVVYAAYRRNFTPEETAAWTEAKHVLPDFAAWLAPQSPPRPPGIVVSEHQGRVEILAWDGISTLPATILSRAAEAGEPATEIAMAREKAGLDVGAPVRKISGAQEISNDKGGVLFKMPDGGEAVFPPVALQAMDVRDKEVLRAQQQRWRRDRIMWRMFAGVLAALAACVVLEAGMAGLREWLRTRRAALAEAAPAVARVEAANTLALRLEQISAQRLMPFEMLATVNDKRPRAVEFTRVTTAGLWRMDIEAQTPNAAELRDFERDLRALAAIERVELREPRTREGLTTFRLEVVFRPGWTRGGGV